MVRTRNLRRLINALLAHLSGFVVVEGDGAGSLQLNVVAFVRDGDAVLAPPEIGSVLPSLERRLAARGVRVVDQPWADVDRITGELVVPEPRLEVDWAALQELEALDGRSRLDGSVPAGRYPVAGWGFGVAVGQQGPISRALAVMLAGNLLRNRGQVGDQAALDGLARVMRQIVPVALWEDRPEDLVDRLAALG